MSKLEQLIKELCPDGVEYRPLGEIANYSGTRIPASEVDEESYVGVDNLLQNKQGKINSEYVPTGGNLTKYFATNILIGNIRPYLRKIWFATNDGGANGDVLIIQNTTNRLSSKFLYHVLASEAFFLYNIQKSKGAKMPRGDKSAIIEFQIPLPPLPVQEEIVKILDNFTELTASITKELTAELSARKKQYEYYRDSLLSFGDNVEWKSLGEVCNKISSGMNKNRTEVGEYPVYGSTGIIAKTNTPVYNTVQILIARVGANAGYVNIAHDKYDVSDNTIMLNVKDDISIYYVYQYLKNMNINLLAKGGGQPLVTSTDIKKIKIPTPPQEEQERIVAILDRFDTLANDIKEGLPAESEARKKQYEYYRDKLLSFKELET